MSSSPLGGPSTPAAILNHDQSLELELLRERVGGLLQVNHPGHIPRNKH